MAPIYAEAHPNPNPLWAPLVTVLAAQKLSGKAPLVPALRDYILLITILVAFLEVSSQQLSPIQATVVMGLSGITRINPDI